MATRTRKQTIVQAPIEQTTESVKPDELKIDWAYLIKGEASWKRFLVAAVASLATSFATGYIGGYLVSYLTLAAGLMSGSLFIMTAIYVLGVLLVMYASYRTSMFAYVKVIDKSVDRACASAYDYVTGFFKSGKELSHA